MRWAVLMALVVVVGMIGLAQPTSDGSVEWPALSNEEVIAHYEEIDPPMEPGPQWLDWQCFKACWKDCYQKCVPTCFYWSWWGFVYRACLAGCAGACATICGRLCWF